eukprot:767996-Hanusia_phi.AAC.5
MGERQPDLRSDLQRDDVHEEMRQTCKRRCEMRSSREENSDREGGREGGKEGGRRRWRSRERVYRNQNEGNTSNCTPFWFASETITLICSLLMLARCQVNIIATIELPVRPTCLACKDTSESEPPVK